MPALALLALLPLPRSLSLLPHFFLFPPLLPPLSPCAISEHPEVLAVPHSCTQDRAEVQGAEMMKSRPVASGTCGAEGSQARPGICVEDSRDYSHVRRDLKALHS